MKTNYELTLELQISCIHHQSIVPLKQCKNEDEGNLGYLDFSTIADWSGKFVVIKLIGWNLLTSHQK